MLVLETFILMFLSAALGLALGRLLGAAYGSDEPTDRPWLRDYAVRPATPALPPAPALLSDAERARLAVVEATPAPAVAAPAIVAAPVAPVVEAPPAPAVVTEPAPVAAPALSTEDTAKAVEADAHGARPAGLLAPRDGKADDLKRIKGIGRQNEARLNALGVWHFDQIAGWTPDNVKWAGSFLAFVGRIEREDWVGQAKVLAAGGSTEFAARVDAGEVPTSQG
jgi:predicted flap endonuclease-1-like 5' DNA nuclease